MALGLPVGFSRASQYSLFDNARVKRGAVPNLPEGFIYKPELISPVAESQLLAKVRELPFRDFEFRGYTGKRRVVSFGWQYDFSAHHLRKADEIPEFLQGLRTISATFAGLEPEELSY